MDVTVFLEIGIVGIALSFLIQLIKSKFGTDSFTTKGITLGLSVVLGAGFFFLQGTAFFASAIGVLGAATVFYAFFLK